MLKQLVRDHIDPGRDLGHSDKGGKKKAEQVVEVKEEEKVKRNSDGTVCEDCK